MKNELNGWIPVSDRLPEEGGEDYLVIINGIISIGLFRSDHNKFHSEIHNDFDKVTHWQPLPKLPEVKNGTN